MVTQQAQKEERRLGKRRAGAWGQEVASEDSRKAAGKGDGEVSLPALGNCLHLRDLQAWQLSASLHLS